MTAQKEKDAGFEKVDRAMTKVKKVKDWGKTGIEGYDVVNDIVSIFDGTYKKKKDNKSSGDGKKKKKNDG